jgi:hemerythrin superfamily protein
MFIEISLSYRIFVISNGLSNKNLIEHFGVHVDHKISKFCMEVDLKLFYGGYVFLIMAILKNEKNKVILVLNVMKTYGESRYSSMHS